MTSTARGHDRPPLPARLAGAVWGHLVGDALGVPYEFRDASAIGTVQWGATGSHHQPPGTWSDDGALMLALLDSLLFQCNGLLTLGALGQDIPRMGGEVLASSPTNSYACADGQARFVNDFVAAWAKVMNLDRFDLA